MALSRWDIFISHASEDNNLVQLLTVLLERRGLEVWVDHKELIAGKGLRDQIDIGLLRSDHGIVVLSPAFLEKDWTNLELGGLVAKFTADYHPKLIPVWHNITYQYLVKRAPMIAGLYAIRTDQDLEQVVVQIVKAVRPSEPIDSIVLTERQDFAREFVAALRERSFSGKTFETNVGEATMREIRATLAASDTDALLELLNSEGIDPEIRNRAAALLFGPRLRDNPAEFSKVLSAARAYDDRHVRAGDWKVLRAVAMSLAHQAHDTEPILDWLARLRSDPGLEEANLAMTDKYYNGTTNAINRTLKNMESFKNPAGRLWDVFYLGRRALPGDVNVVRALESGALQSIHPELVSLCKESLELLTSRQRAASSEV